MKPAKLLVFVLLISTTPVVAQDASFTQAFFNPLYLNPAMAGTQGGMRFVSNYRNQWNNVPGTYSTTTFSMDVFEPKMNSGVGMKVMRDVQGEGYLTTNTMGLVYQYGFKLRREKYIGFGLGGNYGSSFIDWSKLEFSDQFDPKTGKTPFPSGAQVPAMNSFSYGDAEFGALFKSRWQGRSSHEDKMFSIGFSVHHLLRPSTSFYGATAPRSRRYTLHSSLTLPFRGSGLLKGGYVFPSAVLRKQGDFYETLLGIYALREPFILGVAYHNGANGPYFRNTNTIAVIAGYQKPFNNSDNSFQITYSYDLSISGLSFSTFGSHELSAIFFFDAKSILGSGMKGLEESPCLKIRHKGYLPPL